MMIEVQEYILEIEFTKANKTLLDKERNEVKKATAEAKNTESSIPQGFGKPQPDADQFKTVAFTVK